MTKWPCLCTPVLSLLVFFPYFVFFVLLLPGILSCCYHAFCPSLQITIQITILSYTEYMVFSVGVTSSSASEKKFGACGLVSLYRAIFLCLLCSLELTLVVTAVVLFVLFLKFCCFLFLRIEFLRHLRSFFQIMFKIEMKSPEEECKGGEKVLMTCVGTGFSNLSKAIR